NGLHGCRGRLFRLSGRLARLLFLTGTQRGKIRGMKIAYITAGAAGMYCGSCMHDNTLAAALIAKGHDALLIPTYTPIRTDEADVSQRRVFFGGSTVSLQRKSGYFAITPWLLNGFSAPRGRLP